MVIGDLKVVWFYPKYWSELSSKSGPELPSRSGQSCLKEVVRVVTNSFLKRVQAILRNFWVKAQKHDKMDGAEKLLSISQCQTTVVHVYSVTVLSTWSGSLPEQTWLKKCRFVFLRWRIVRVPICLGTEMSHTGAEVSWFQFVPVPKCLEFLSWPVIWRKSHRTFCLCFSWDVLTNFNYFTSWHCLLFADTIYYYLVKNSNRPL